jgi:membrane-associated phospholipid phosphatase
MKLKNKRRLAFFGLILLGFAAVTLFVFQHPVSNFDTAISNEIRKIKHGNFAFIMTAVSVFATPLTMPLTVLAASLVFIYTKHPREARFVLLTLLADLMNFALKLFINRPRPTFEDVEVVLKFKHPSFPSGHVVHYVVFFGFILTVMVTGKKIPHYFRVLIGSLCAFLILSVSVSRIYLGAHWATDVIGAYLFGLFYLGIVLTFYLKLPQEAAKVIQHK